ncbi:MAG: monooxygenase FAD-binding protein [Actinomycetia bacterium]|nr:monooxygenase FAD-binding protein [Actinomycetes bacterium]
MRACDVVIVGGGIAGGALATALADDGRDVVVLEATTKYEDRVRGESMLPWGVKEARDLGVEQTLLDAGAHIAPTWVHYDCGVPQQISEANPIPAAMMVPEVPGSLNLRHPEACNALNAAAQSAGAEVHRGVTDVTITAGAAPKVRAQGADGTTLDIAARLIVGADGRNSTVRRQAEITLHRKPETNMITGLLLEGLDDIPDHYDFLASEGDLFMASFHQGNGQLRVYLCPPVEQRHRFSGKGGLETFLGSAAFSCLPFGDRLARATPAGPLATYPGDDSWVDEPFAEGVVLVGDAAGFNNPIIGQGLSISMRDVRTVRDIVRADLELDAFAAYASERVERMRRLREAARLMAATFSDECDNRDARRAKFFELQQSEPLMLGLLIATFGGPEVGPEEAFDGRLVAEVQAA